MDKIFDWRVFNGEDCYFAGLMEEILIERGYFI